MTNGVVTGINLPADVAVTTTLLPNGRLKDAYLQTVTATGGVGTLTFTVSAGALPPGLTLASDGTISGVPTASGLFTFTVTATDSGTPASVGNQALQILINKRPGKKDEGCTTGENGQSWLLAVAALGLVLAMRRRKLAKG